MKIRVLGGGIYGCHIAHALLDQGHQVELHELADRLFAGASGNIPARLHCGAHYPRSKLTRDACQAHYAEFMATYGDFTRGVACNVYAVAHSSLVDFGTYLQIMRAEIPCIPVDRPRDLGLELVEGAILTGERHILVDRLREHFTAALGGVVRYGVAPEAVDDDRWDQTIDATFCGYDNTAVDRYEVCVTALLRGPVDRAITIMDGPFPSLYPWDEAQGLCSLTSAKYTPLARRNTYAGAVKFRDAVPRADVENAVAVMVEQMAIYYSAIRYFEVSDARVAIRAMPASNADARLVDIRRIGRRGLRIRAGKLDAVFAAQAAIEQELRVLPAAA